MFLLWISTVDFSSQLSYPRRICQLYSEKQVQINEFSLCWQQIQPIPITPQFAGVTPKIQRGKLLKSNCIEVVRFDAMGTECALHLVMDTADQAKSVAKKVITEVERIECRYSRYLESSVLSKINRAANAGISIAVDVETSTLLDYAFRAFRISQGLFDVTSGVLRKAWDFDSAECPTRKVLDEILPFVGMNKLRWEKPILHFSKPGIQLDFGGFGKEYAVDRAAQVCLELNIVSGLIEMGGDIRILGPHPDGSPWKVSIRHPRQASVAAQFLSLPSGSLATSGDYERFMEVDGQRYCHILNPFTGFPVSTWQSISIHAEHCLFAGTIASIAMLKEALAIPWLQTLCVDYYCIDSQGQHFTNVLTTDKSHLN